jgi:hypothetical protein
MWLGQLVQAEYIRHDGCRTERYSHDDVDLEKCVNQAVKQINPTAFFSFHGAGGSLVPTTLRAVPIFFFDILTVLDSSPNLSSCSSNVNLGINFNGAM